MPGELNLNNKDIMHSTSLIAKITIISDPSGRRAIVQPMPVKLPAKSGKIRLSALWLFIFWLMVLSQSWADGLEVYVNNKPFSDKVVKYSGVVYADAAALTKVIKDFRFDPGTGNYIWNGAVLIPERLDAPGAGSGLYFSLRKLVELSRGRYEYNPKTNILDVYTFSSETVASNISKQVFSAESVTTEDNLQYLMGRIKELLKTELNMDLGDYPIEILFIDKSALQSVSHNSRTMGSAQYQVQNRKVVELKIFIARDLLLADAVHTAAHEIAHAWGGLKGYTAKDIVEEEGFSEWVAYKILRYFNYDREAEDMLRKTDPVYGEGLRRLLAREKQFGSAWVMKFKKTNKCTLF
jgi:hypothetical protein